MMEAAGIINRYFRLPPEEIAFFKYIIEGYDGIGVVTTCDRRQAVMRVMVVETSNELMNRIIAALKQEFPLSELEPGAFVDEDLF